MDKNELITYIPEPVHYRSEVREIAAIDLVQIVFRLLLELNGSIQTLSRLKQKVQLCRRIRQNTKVESRSYCSRCKLFSFACREITGI